MKQTARLLIAILFALSVQTPSDSAPSGSAQGKKLFAAMNCAGCHSINEVGGCMGPPLAGVSKRRGDDYLRMRLSEKKEAEFIKAMKHPELFPHPRFKKGQVEQLIVYLRSLQPSPTPRPVNVHTYKPTVSKPRDADKPPPDFQPMKPGASSREGRRLFLATGCMSCHSVYGAGGLTGPSLDGVGFRRSRSYIEAHITNPQANLRKYSKVKVASKMVQEDLFPDQVHQIADFLLTLPARKE